MTLRRATCACGQLAVACEGEPVRVSVCHCLDCQRRTGSAFGVQARWQKEQVAVEGRTRSFARVADSGKTVTFRFCPDCGSTVSWSLEDFPDVVAVAVGAFADRGFPAPTVSVYDASRRHAWVDLRPDGPLERRG
jgi:hypothetical protein